MLLSNKTTAKLAHKDQYLRELFNLGMPLPYLLLQLPNITLTDCLDWSVALPPFPKCRPAGMGRRVPIMHAFSEGNL
jgi:hypothetical protein